MDDDDASMSPSLSPASSSPLPVASALPVADPVTVASVPPGGLMALALPIQKHGAYPSHGSGGGSGGGGGGGGREDAWSEGATSALIDAWGERFVALGRGSLRHPQWQEVAESVSARDNYSKAPKSDVQCKNRIDTLKKKYKIERAKPASSWQFFDRLDVLLAPTYSSNHKPAAPHPNGRNAAVPTALRVGFPQRSRTPLMPASAGTVKRRAPSPELSAASSESSDGFPPEPVLPAANGKRRRTDEGRVDGIGSGGERTQGLRELAQAIRRFGEAYERVETAKLEQTVEMERQRLDFARELESQRVQFFLNTQMELSQAKNHTSPAAAAASPATAGGISRRMSSVPDNSSRRMPPAPDSSSRRMASFPDARTRSNHHGRYRASDGSRHHHRPAPRPHYQYHENNVAPSAAASDGEQSEEEEEEEDEEEDDNEEESQ